MMKEHYDVLVIGGGIAGCIAAKAAQDAGRKVAMIFPNGGASELSSGVVDIAGVIPGECAKICENYLDGVELLGENFPAHPYRYSADVLAQGLSTLSDLAAKGGYSLCSFENSNVWIPNIMGTFSIAALVPEVLVGAVATAEKEQVLVVGFKGNVSFNAESCANSYRKYQKKLGFHADYVSTELELEGMGDRRKLSDGELADYLDTDAGIKELSRKLTSFCSNNRCKFDKILFPPVLGYVHTSEILKQLREIAGCKVAEVLTSCNSIAGYRMTRAIYSGLKDSGVKLICPGKAESIRANESEVTVSATLGITDQYHPGTKVEYTAAAVVLATGGFLGGGISARHTSVWINLLEQELGNVKAGQINRNAVCSTGQGMLRMGAAVNDNLSAKTEDTYGRVFVCGALLMGFNSASERSGTGVAVATGCKAGTNAAAKA